MIFSKFRAMLNRQVYAFYSFAVALVPDHCGGELYLEAAHALPTKDMAERIVALDGVKTESQLQKEMAEDEGNSDDGAGSRVGPSSANACPQCDVDISLQLCA